MTYTELKALLASYMARNDTGSLVDSWILMAESKFNRELRTPFQEETAYSDMDNEYIAVPTNMLSVRAMVRDDDGKLMRFYRPIDYRNIIDDDPWELSSANDESIEPIWTAEDMQFRVYPYPTSSDTLRVRILFFAKIPALSSTNETNWLLDSHPDVYVAQCCLNGAMTFKATADQIAKWSDTVTQGLNTLKTQRLEAMVAQTLKTDIPARGGFNINTGV